MFGTILIVYLFTILEIPGNSILDFNF